MKSIKETTYKGTRILLGNDKQDYINRCRKYLVDKGYVEIQLPIINKAEYFKGKVGEENNNMMYTLTDRGGRDLCLAPEYTAIIQELSKTVFKQEKDLKIFYVAECFRGEKPQAGRYRQFTQLGVEVINPTTLLRAELSHYATTLTRLWKNDIDIDLQVDVTRGLDYYKEGSGFEITATDGGSSKQLCGGGSYDGGIGFALGIDRIINY